MTKKEAKIKIFVSHHKPGYIYEDDIFIPIQIGKKNAKIDLGILGDDTGDNISDKNPNYAELTAQYWVWKNYDLSDVDYVGFCHYRRYMTYLFHSNIINLIRNCKNLNLCYNFRNEHHYITNFSSDLLLNNSKNLKLHILKTCKDIYLPKKSFNFGYPYVNLCTDNLRAREISRSCLEEVNPLIFSVFLENEKRKTFNLKNMFIMKKQEFFEFSNRLFSYLFLFEKKLQNEKIDIGTLFNNDTRFMGIHSENLITIYTEYQEKKGKSIAKGSDVLFLK